MTAMVIMNTKAIISTRAPTGGATPICWPGWLKAANFYSRPHGRGDTSTQRYGSYYSISTRAPTGGATEYSLPADLTG